MVGRGRFPAYRLGWRIQALRERADPAAAVLEALLAGTLELSHAARDREQGESFPVRTVPFLRAAVIDHGVLERRDHKSASFARLAAAGD